MKSDWKRKEDALFYTNENLRLVISVKIDLKNLRIIIFIINSKKVNRIIELHVDRQEKLEKLFNELDIMKEKFADPLYYTKFILSIHEFTSDIYFVGTDNLRLKAVIQNDSIVWE